MTTIKISDFFEEDQIIVEAGDAFFIKVYNLSKDKNIKIIFDETKILPALKEYVLPESMTNLKLQEITSSKPMSLEEFWLARYLLLILGKDKKEDGYLFHVQLEQEVVAIELFCITWPQFGGKKTLNYTVWPLEHNFKMVAGYVFVWLP